MMLKEELLQYIHKTADMGVSGLEDVLPKTEDQELFSILEKQKTQYEKVRQEARRLLERQGESVNDASAMAKLSANMMSAGKLLFDASPEKIAELFTLDTIDAQTAELRIPSKDTPVLVYCRSGARSYEAALRLRALGYRRVYDIGSMVGWPYGSV